MRKGLKRPRTGESIPENPVWEAWSKGTEMRRGRRAKEGDPANVSIYPKTSSTTGPVESSPYTGAA